MRNDLRERSMTATPVQSAGSQPTPKPSWRRAQRALGLGMAAIALAALAAACGGGGGKGDKTSTPGTDPSTTAEASTTPGQNAGLKTPIAISPGSELTPQDLANRGTGTPGRGDFTGARLVIPKIEVDAPFSYKVVGADGQMPNPNSWDDVAYYDFSQWPDLGGLPGKGGNIVVAGHVDYIRHGPAVFWRMRELEAGDVVTIKTTDGSEINYKIEFNKVLDPEGADWTGIVAATADESITLITCTGQFEAGHYNNRQIAWGRRV